MDDRNGRIYESKEAALADGVPEGNLVTGPHVMLRAMSRAIKRAQRGSFKTFPPGTGAHGEARRYCGNAGCSACAATRGQA